MEMAGRADVIAKSDGRFVEMVGWGGLSRDGRKCSASCLWLVLLEDCS